jgi:hypothetical protein
MILVVEGKQREAIALQQGRFPKNLIRPVQIKKQGIHAVAEFVPPGLQTQMHDMPLIEAPGHSAAFN